MKEVALFYAIGAVLASACFASLRDHSGTWRGKPLKYPRLVGSLAVGAFWPVFIAQLFVGRRP